MAIHTASMPSPNPPPTLTLAPSLLTAQPSADAGVAAEASQPPDDPQNGPVAAGRQEAVVLIHGLCGHWLAMLPLANKLRRAGFYPINWGYRSVWGDVAGHARGLERKLLELEQDPAIATIHVVAHSMGSIVARQAILNHHPSKLGRVVMLCPPNGGSHVATRFAPVLGLICKTLVEITDLPDSWVNRLPTTLPSRTPVGVIVAGGDLVVAPESTHLPGVEQRLVIPGMHSGVLLKAATAEATIRFLRTASF